jgi:NB-ARC domain
MVASNNLDRINAEEVLKFVEDKVLKHTGTRLSVAEKLVIKGSWDGKDYTNIAREFEYNTYYLQQKVGPRLWLMLSEVFGGGVKVKKAHFKEILLKQIKKHYVQLEASKLNNDSLVGKTKFYGEFPKITSFCGREEDLNCLKNQIRLFNQRCLTIIGVGGIGKTYFAAKLVEEIIFESPNLYDYVAWKEVKHCFSIDQLVNDLIDIFNIEKGTNKSLKYKISLISKHLSSCRCLLVIDGFEKLASAESFKKRIGYEEFFIELAKEQKNSCTIVTSQIPLKEFTHVTTNLPFLYWKLEGLDLSAAMQLFHEKGLSGDECKKLIEIYRGNPSELEAVAEKIHRFFGGNIESFFEYRTTVISSRFQAMLHKQFEPNGFLNNLQRTILIYLAKQLEEDLTPVPFTKLIDDLKVQLGLQLSVFEIMADIDILEQRSLVERNTDSEKKEISYSLQPVIKKYILIDPLGLIEKEFGEKKIYTSD